MKRIAEFGLISLLAVSVFAQHYTGSLSGRGAPGGFRAPALMNSLPHAPVPRHHTGRRAGFYPYALPVFDGSDDFQYPAEPNVILVPQPAPQVVVPPREVRPEIREYSLPAQGAATPPPAEPGEESTFAIALADGSRHAANAVWVQNGFLHFVDTDDEHHQIPLSAVDRQLTRRLNREKNLAVWLPAH